MASSGNTKKGKKSKGKAIALDVFLCDRKSDAGSGQAVVMVPKRPPNYSWADQMEDEELSASEKQKIIVPTAPRSARVANVDDDKIPQKPPYTAYIANVPFETEEEDVLDFFSNLKVKEVRLPKEGGKLRGFAYAEFEDRASLAEAIAMNDSILKGRKVRIDLAGATQDGKIEKWAREDQDKPDRTLGDWRSAPKDEADGERGSRNGSDRDGSFDDRDWDRGYGPPRDRGYGNRDRGYGDRDRGYADRDRGFGDRERGYRDRGFGDRDRGFGEYSRDRGFGDRERDRGFDRGFGSDRRYGDRSGDRDRDRNYGDWDRYDQRDFYERGFDRGERRGFGSGSRDGDYGYDERRGGGYDRGGSYYRDKENGEPPEREIPRERPKLNLTRRTKPLEDPAKVSSQSAIFGGAKPVDTAAKEREIEERLKREQSTGDERRDYLRRKDEDKRDDEKQRDDYVKRDDRRRDEKRRDDDRSSRSKENSDYGSEPEDERQPPEGSAKPLSPRKEDPKAVPAPPPKENAWTKRAETVKQQQSRDVQPVIDKENKAPEEKQRLVQDEEDYRHNTSGKPSNKKSLTDHGRDQEDSGQGRSQGRGRGGEQSRGRGDGRPPKITNRYEHERKMSPDERKLNPERGRSDRQTRSPDRRADGGERRRSPDRPRNEGDKYQMPKYEEPKPPNFAGANRYANLQEDEDFDD